jgi:LacI family transcriptional regulator
MEGAKKIAALRPRVDGVFSAAGDIAAVGAINALKGMGYKIPGDIRVVGYDGIEESEYFDPPLTTVRQPISEMSAKAVDFLLDALAGKAENQNAPFVFKPKLVVRQSS